MKPATAIPRLSTTKPERDPVLFVGTYVDRIHVVMLERSTGRLRMLQTVTGVEQPSYIACHRNGTACYAISESYDGRVTALAVDREAMTLQVLNSISTGGHGPAHVSIAPDQKHLLVANYKSGTWAVIELLSAHRLGPRRQIIGTPGVRGGIPSQPHWIGGAPLGRSIYGCDAGADTVVCWQQLQGGRFSLGSATKLILARGSGPRHLAFHPCRACAYVVCEFSSEAIALAYDTDTGALHSGSPIKTTPHSHPGSNAPSAIRVTGDGCRVFVSNRGDNSIAWFDVDQSTGGIEPAGSVGCAGATPRDFEILSDTSMLVIANQDSDALVAMAIDRSSGTPKVVDRLTGIAQPACIALAPE